MLTNSLIFRPPTKEPCVKFRKDSNFFWFHRLVVNWRICSLGEFVLHSVKHLVPGWCEEEERQAGSRRPAPASCQGPATVGRTRASRVKKYNEFHGGVRCHTFNSRRAACTLKTFAGGFTPLEDSAHGKRATAAGANSNRC